MGSIMYEMYEVSSKTCSTLLSRNFERKNMKVNESATVDNNSMADGRGQI